MNTTLNLAPKPNMLACNFQYTQHLTWYQTRTFLFQCATKGALRNIPRVKQHFTREMLSCMPPSTSYETIFVTVAASHVLYFVVESM